MCAKKESSMGEVDFFNTFLEHYSLGESFIFIITILVGAKILSSLFEWLYGKLNTYFAKKSQKEKMIEELKVEQGKIIKGLEEVSAVLVGVEEQIRVLTNRLQENSKSYIIDKHHYFCHQIKAIDDFSLQSLEIRYMYYKSEGGDTYIDGLMQEVRELPKIDMRDIEAIVSKKGEEASGTSLPRT